MNQPCPISIYAGKPGCDGLDEPVANFSSEAADTLYFTGIGFSNYHPYAPPPLGGGMYVAASCVGVEVSAQSQQEANLLAAQSVGMCQVTNGGGGIAVGGTGTGAPTNNPGAPPPPTLGPVVNSEQSASGSCSTLATFSYTVPAGTFAKMVDVNNIAAIAAAQSAVDGHALAYAQYHVKNFDHCIGSSNALGVIGMCLNVLYSSTNLFVLAGSPTNVHWVSAGLPHGVSLVPGTTTAVTDDSGDSWVKTGTDTWLNLTSGVTQQGQPQGTASGNTGTADLFGTPTQAGDYPFTITAHFGSNSSTFSGTITVIGFTNNSPLPTGSVCNLYQQQLQALGGTAPYTFSVDPLTPLPNGLSIFVGYGTWLQGNPNPGTYHFNLMVTDSVGRQCVKPFVLTIIPSATQPSITTSSPLTSAYVGSIYLGGFFGTGGCPPFKYSLASGTLPPSFSVFSSGGFTGYPSSADLGNWSFSIRATDNGGQTVTKAFTLSVLANPIVWGTASPLPTGSVCSAYNQTLSVSGGYPASLPAPPYTFAEDPLDPLPAGLTLTGAVLSGVLPAGTYSFRIIAHDTVQSLAKAFTLTINPSATQPSITTGTPLPQAGVTIPYSMAITASGGCPGYTFTLVSGALPSSLTLSAGFISGTPTAGEVGNYSFSIKATDFAGQTDTKAFTLVVHAYDLVVSGACVNNPAITAKGGADNVTSYPTPGYRLHANADATAAAAIANLAANLNTAGCGCPPCLVSVDPVGKHTTFYNSSSSCTITLVPNDGHTPYSYAIGPQSPPFDLGLHRYQEGNGWPSADLSVDIGGGNIMLVHYSDP